MPMAFIFSVEVQSGSGTEGAEEQQLVQRLMREMGLSFPGEGGGQEEEEERGQLNSEPPMTSCTPPLQPKQSRGWSRGLFR